MAVKSLKSSSIIDYKKSNSMLAGYSFQDFELIESVFLSANAASVTFSNLNQYATEYKHLQIRWVARNSSAVSSTSLRFRINESTTGYSDHYIDGNGSSMSSGSGTTDTFGRMGRLTAASQTSGNFASGIMDILDFSSTVKNKTVKTISGSAGYTYLSLYSSLWASTNQITSFEIINESGSVIAGSRFSLYGIR